MAACAQGGQSSTQHPHPTSTQDKNAGRSPAPTWCAGCCPRATHEWVVHMALTGNKAKVWCWWRSKPMREIRLHAAAPHGPLTARQERVGREQEQQQQKSAGKQPAMAPAPPATAQTVAGSQGHVHRQTKETAQAQLHTAPHSLLSGRMKELCATGQAELANMRSTAACNTLLPQPFTPTPHARQGPRQRMSAKTALLLVLTWRWLCLWGSPLNALLLLSLDRQCHCGGGEHVYM